ncbi:MFS transporter, partial [Salmonella enterica subsp. enterica]|nr:MFS transporter [Salmonella enterica subsp. enterica serovar Mbandaka]
MFSGKTAREIFNGKNNKSGVQGLKGGNSMGEIDSIQIRNVSAVSAAHMLSHFCILAIPVMIPVITMKTDVSYLQLGTGIAIFNLVTALLQIYAGILVDKYNPKTFLLYAILLSSAGFSLIAFQFNLHFYYVAMIIAGVANAAYHPCNYALLSQNIRTENKGRIFSIHTCSGFLGGALAPLVLVFIAEKYGLQAAFLVVSVLSVGIFLFVSYSLKGATHSEQGLRPKVQQFRQPDSTDGSLQAYGLARLFSFFFLLGICISAIEKFFVASLVNGHGYNLEIANMSLTGFLFSTVAGVIAGGILADKITNHDNFVGAMFCCATLCLSLIALMKNSEPGLVLLMITCGMFIGAVSPSRDILVTKLSPKGSHGRMFGIVSTGFNAGNIIGPVFFGWL